MAEAESTFKDALRRILRVPRHELEAEERKHADAMKERREARDKRQAS